MDSLKESSDHFKKAAIPNELPAITTNMTHYSNLVLLEM